MKLTRGRRGGRRPSPWDAPPPDARDAEPWPARFLQELEARSAGRALPPVILELKELIDSDPVVRMYVTDMIAQVPAPFRAHHPRDVPQLLRHLGALLTMAPEYNASALAGTPLYALLFWTAHTPAGQAAYRNAALNRMLGKILSAWSAFLGSEASRYVLNATERGWQCEAARARLHMEDYEHDPGAPFWGFSSWNDFFTRRLVPGARPIDGEDDPGVVVAACDSVIHRVRRGVRRTARFWIKSEPYSMEDMLGHEHVDGFVGGDVLQAFLSPFDYHRWHSPVAGTIRAAYVKEGLYFSVPPPEVGRPEHDRFEGYLAHVQTRALLFIEADNPVIGLMCLMPVGMVEVSSCVIHEGIRPGVHVEKGQELGLFQFGGSTHCLIFRPGVIKEVLVPVDEEWTDAEAPGWPVRMGQAVAIANSGAAAPVRRAAAGEQGAPPRGRRGGGRAPRR